MKTFKDNQGQTWTLSLTLQKNRAIRDQIGLDVFNPMTLQQILKNLTDRFTFCWFMVEQQAKTLGISEEDFEERIYGDRVMVEASIALSNEIEVFTLKLGEKGLAMIAKKFAENFQKDQERVSVMVENGQLEKLLDKEIREAEAMMQKELGDG